MRTSPCFSSRHFAYVGLRIGELLLRPRYCLRVFTRGMLAGGRAGDVNAAKAMATKGTTTTAKTIPCNGAGQPTFGYSPTPTFSRLDEPNVQEGGVVPQMSS